ncbi:MAG: ATP-grasp domain-containing protein [Lachnospiraceae bacterium]|nr:ATP-grasp domain-containing protein [Lachnospiraceae bacterium]
MKKLLILNGSHSDIPLIRAGKKQGYYVITSGNREDLIGHSYADEYIYGDFSNPEGMLQIFKDKKIDAICSCCNDFGAITASYMCENLGLPGHDSYSNTLIIHHKDKFKQFSMKYDIPTPRANSYTNLEKALADIEYYKDKYPLIVKPIDMTGGKGVSKILDNKGYESSIRFAFEKSFSKGIVIEQFLTGTQHSFSTFLVNGKVVAYYSDNEYSFASPYLVSTSCGPATKVNLVKDELITIAEKIAGILKLKNGVFHYQYILCENKPYIIEITRRCSGDMYPIPVERSTGIPWAEWIVKAECGMSCNDFPRFMNQKKLGGRHCLISDKNGIIKNIYISEKIRKNIYADFRWSKEGDVIQNHLVDKIGVIFLEFENEDEMIEKSENILNYVKVICE